ncbi:MAG: hypothetical protein IH845_04360 [Nanoarchaeota archaeon]|nr:hypothetical protein [Nanoarchaeota archaeon]
MKYPLGIGRNLGVISRDFVPLDQKHFHEDANPMDAWAFFAEEALDPKSLRREIYVAKFKDDLYHLIGIRIDKNASYKIRQTRYTRGNLGIIELSKGLVNVTDLKKDQLFYVVGTENQIEYKFLE